MPAGTKTLLLLRHAKSSWDSSARSDFDRPLAPRGRHDAPRMGRLLAERGPLPEAVVSSPAARARETIELFLEGAAVDVVPRFDQTVYGASVGALLEVVRGLPEKGACALLVGHNPGFEELLAALTESGGSMPTAALACIDLGRSRWDEVAAGDGELRWLATPKEIGD
jgi:phosphohistidine phosphatase